VPLELPQPRGAIPVPISVVHSGSPRAGVAGLGWDVPLSYVRRSTKPWHRKPSAYPRPGAGEQLQLVMGGASSLMVASGDHYVPFVASDYQELRFDEGAWHLTTLDNLEYVFTSATMITADGGMPDPDLWLLTRIRDRTGRDEVELEYAVDGVGGCGKELRLTGVRYTFDHAEPNRTALYAIHLDYRPWWRPGSTTGACAVDPATPGQIATAYEHVQEEGLGFGRVRVLDRIRIMARDNLAPPAAPGKEIREYQFAYAPDAATTQPRLTDVTSTGEEGTAMGALALPVARYAYGPTAQLVPANSQGASGPATTETAQIAFGFPTEVARPFMLPSYVAGITTEVTSKQKLTKGSLFHDVGWRTKTKLRHVLRDFTGDGLPDLLYRVEGNGDDDWHWQMHVNHLGPNGPDLSGMPTSWVHGQGPAELQMSTTLRFDHPVDDVDIEAAMVTSETWSTFADWNGDGRLDVIDADGGADRDHWKVWINHPAGNGVDWQPIQVDVGHVRDWLADQGYEQVEEMDLDIHEQDDWSINLPIQRSRTWTNFVRGVVQRFECTGGGCQQIPLDPDDPAGLEQYVYNQVQGQDTVTEWKLEDVNQDGFLDFYAADKPAKRCVQHHFGGVGGWQCGQNPGPLVPGTYYCSDRVREYVITQEYCEDLEDPSIPFPLPDSAYNVNYLFLNQLGPFTVADRSPFAATPMPWFGSAHGVEAWVQDNNATMGTTGFTTSGDALGVTWQSRGLADPQRTGQLNLVGLGSVLSSDVRFDSDQGMQCGHDGQTHRTVQNGGLADLNGDGLADRITPVIDPAWQPTPQEPRPRVLGWQVRFATAAQGDIGGGFGPPRDLVGHPLMPFALSESTGVCGDNVVHTVAGLTDMDGDGRPELIRAYPDGALLMSRLTTAEGPASLAAGKLVSIDNLRGARTTIEYGNRKQIGPADGSLPYPEVVVTAVRTGVTDGSAPDSAPTYYGYGRPSLSYDPLAGRWMFDGYARTVMVSGTPNQWVPGAVDGVVTINDRNPPAPPGASYADHILSRQWTGTSMIERWAVSPTMVPQFLQWPAMAFAGKTTGFRTQQLVQTQWPTGDARYDCADLVPHTGSPIGGGLCGAAGLVQVLGTESWEGWVGPPGTSSVWSAARVETIDEWGRPLRMHDQGDTRRTDDDRCTTIAYAATADGRPFPSVPSRVTTDDCGLGSPEVHDNPPLITLASTGYRYDELPEGTVHAGLLTSRTVDRFAGGVYLDTIEGETLEYGTFGQVTKAHSTRLLGTPVTRETTITYDAFKASATGVAIDATDLPPRSSTTLVSTWPSHPSTSISPSGAVTTVARDGLGRPLTVSTRPAGGADTTLRRMTYHDGDDGTWRRVDVDVFPVGTTPGSEDTATDRQRDEVVLDAFGRPRYQRRHLGADYGQSTLVSGLVEYDALGRVVFEAQPFEVTPLANLEIFDPSVMTTPPYGRTTVYDLRGRVTRSIDTQGHNDQVWSSSLATNTFVTSLSYGYMNGQASVQITGPDGNDPTADQAWVHATVWRTALGRELERTTVAAGGQILERQASETDRLGRVVRTLRYGAEGTTPVVWQASYDSLGRRLTLQEANQSPQTSTYDEDGNLLETRWLDAGFPRITRQHYDALGRVTERIVAHANTGGMETVESTDRYHYDTAFGPHAPGDGDYLGRLAAATTDGVGGVYYAYDALGRPVTTTYDYTSQSVVRERAAWTTGGRLTDLTLEAGATVDRIHYAYDSAARVRQVRDGAGSAVYFDASAITADGHYQQVAYGNGVVAQFHREPQGRRLLTDWSAVTASGLYAFQNRHDVAGRVRHERHELPDSIAEIDERYDGLGRLTATFQVGGTDPGAEFYAYDSLGNLTGRTASTSTGSREYTTDSSDPDRLCHYAAIGQAWGPCHFSYDQAGNVTEDRTRGWDMMDRRLFAYDSGQRLTSIHRGAVTADFTYGPLGRVSTTVTGPTPHEVWSFGSLVEKRVRADGTAQLERRIPGPLGVVATLRHDGTNQVVVYAHGDGRGNRFFTDDTGHAVQTTTYGTYGQVTSDSGAGSPLTYSDDLWNGGDDLRELGVVLLGPRAYDPDLGRFLQRDPLIHTGGGSSANPYSFAFDDPVNFGDPTGLDGGPVDCYPCADPAPAPINYGNGGGGGGGTPSSTPAPVAVPTGGPVTPLGMVLRGVSPHKFTEVNYDTLAASSQDAEDLLVRLNAVEQSALASGHEITYYALPDVVVDGAIIATAASDEASWGLGRLARHGISGTYAFESGSLYKTSSRVAFGVQVAVTGGSLVVAGAERLAIRGGTAVVASGGEAAAATGGPTKLFRVLTSLEPEENMMSNAAKGLAARGPEITNPAIHEGLSMWDTVEGAASRIPVLERGGRATVYGIAEVAPGPGMSIVPTFGAGHYTVTGTVDTLMSAWTRSLLVP